MRVMIVDDSKLLRMKISMILETLGYEIVGEAKDGQEAVELYGELRPDFMTMDVEMPKMNGLEAVQAISGEYPDVKVVWVSTIVNQHVMEEAKRLCQSVITPKPVEENALKEAIDKLYQLQMKS